MTNELANQIYDILVTVCQASAWERESFIHIMTTDQPSEWRFRGNLGFGGKLYPEGRFPVSCYCEDRTPERREIMDKANALLRPLLYPLLDERLRAIYERD